MISDERYEQATIEPTLYPDQPVSVRFDSGMLWVGLADGRIIGAPSAWFPFLRLATEAQRQRYDLYPASIEWPELDDGISIEGLLKGNKVPWDIEEYQQRMASLRNSPATESA